LTTEPINQDSFVVSSARKVIEYIDEIKNTEIADESLHELEIRFRTLVDVRNSNPLIPFPVEIVTEPIDKIVLGIRSTQYFSKLKFSEVYFIIDRLRQVESLDDGLCLDVLCVLIDYSNIVIYSRFDHGLALEEQKNIDENWSSSSAISTHLANGEDSCIT
jgi:hypothetical protein